MDQDQKTESGVTLPGSQTGASCSRVKGGLPWFIGGVVLGAAALFLVQRSQEGTLSPDPVVAQVNGTRIHASEAFGNIKAQLFNLEEQVYQTKMQAVSTLVEQKVLEGEARRLNTTVDQLLAKWQGSQKEAPISDQTIDDFLKSKGVSPTDPRIRKDDVRNYLRLRSQMDQRQAYVDSIKKSSTVKILLTPPSEPHLSVATEGYPAWGKASAPVTIVEFSDFQCPFCKEASKTMDTLKATYGPDKVRIVFRDFPLPRHPRAIPSALAAYCADQQGKFWEFHNLLFGNQDKLQDGDFTEYAKKVGANLEAFNKCLSQKVGEAHLQKGIREAETSGIQATPSFVINGALIQGAQPLEKFKERIDRAIASK